jgi:hypothetical protein
MDRTRFRGGDRPSLTGDGTEVIISIAAVSVIPAGSPRSITRDGTDGPSQAIDDFRECRGAGNRTLSLLSGVRGVIARAVPRNGLGRLQQTARTNWSRHENLMLNQSKRL